RVAVGRRLGDGGGPDIAVGAGAVVDDERLPELVEQLGTDAAGQKVDAAAGLGRRHQRHRFTRPALRRGHRRREQRGSAGEDGSWCEHMSSFARRYISMPAALMIGPHLATSLAMKARSSAGVPPTVCRSSASNSLWPAGLLR